MKYQVMCDPSENKLKIATIRISHVTFNIKIFKNIFIIIVAALYDIFASNNRSMFDHNEFVIWGFHKIYRTKVYTRNFILKVWVWFMWDKGDNEKE